MKLLTPGKSNAKTEKSEKAGLGYSTVLMHLAPAKLSGREVCASRSDGCTIACLNTAGRGRFDKTQQARINRTMFYFEDRRGFIDQLKSELASFVRKCNREQLKPCFRPNATSDLMWEVLHPELFHIFSDVQWYDYTKHYKRCLKRWKLPDNYHLTFSRSENNWEKCRRVLRAGRVNVATVFDSKQFPAKWRGWDVYSADETDLRFLDPAGGKIGALYAKGEGKRDKTGFVVHVGGKT